VATLISTLITNARTTLNEPAASFWSDAELLVHATDAIKDMWRAVVNLDQGYFETRDESSVSMAANSYTLTGVPADVFRVKLIEPRDLSQTSAAQNMTFEPRSTNHADFSGARGLDAVDPSGITVYFQLLGAGSPIAAPTIEVAPKLTTAVNLRLIYTATIGTLTAASNNPIPGESDKAITAWVIAHARARERAKRDPDPEWMAIYAAEKAHILETIEPRQTQEPQIAEAMFEAWWQ
jgi:hypothetical protein